MSKYEEALEKVKAIKKSYTKGTQQWYTDKGKLIINGNSYNDTKKIVVATLKKYKDKFLGTVIIHVDVIFHDNLEDLMDKNKGGIEVQVTIYKVEEVLGKISLQYRDQTHSFVSMFYSYKELIILNPIS